MFPAYYAESHAFINNISFAILLFSHSYHFLLADAVNLLSLTNSDTRTSMDEIGAHINQVVDKNDFTIMFTIRSQVGFAFIHSLTHTHTFLLYDKCLFLILALTNLHTHT